MLDRRRNFSGVAANHIKVVRSRHEQIIRLDCAGVSNKDIATIMGLSESHVSSVKNSAVYIAARDQYRDKLDQKSIDQTADVEKRIKELSGKSIDVLEELLDSSFTDDKVKADVAFDILDRAGHAAPQKVEHEHTFNLGAHVKSAYERRKARLASDTTIELPAIEDATQSKAPEGEESETQLDDEDDSAVIVR